LAALTVLVLALASEVRAGDTNVRVAANFTEPAKEIASTFSKRHGHGAILSFGATEEFYTQITQAAPFQVFLAADEETPKKLADDGLAVADSLFTYAIGKLVPFSTNATMVTGEQTLRDAKFNKSYSRSRGCPFRRGGGRNDEKTRTLRDPRDRRSSGHRARPLPLLPGERLVGHDGVADGAVVVMPTEGSSKSRPARRRCNSGAGVEAFRFFSTLACPSSAASTIESQ
jgi:hypothetical protein